MENNLNDKSIDIYCKYSYIIFAVIKTKTRGGE
jgi:hypothetical protein